MRRKKFAEKKKRNKYFREMWPELGVLLERDREKRKL